MEETNQEVAFSKIARLYDSVYKDKDYAGEARTLCRYITAGARVLDIGCGTGRHAEHLIADNRNRVFGVEPCPAMAGTAESRGVSVISGKVQLLSSERIVSASGGRLDYTIAMFDVLDYVLTNKEYHNAMMTISGSMRVGGFFYYEGWNMNTMPQHYAHLRTKHFMFDGRMWTRVSRTTYQCSKFIVRFNYSAVGESFMETHILRPRLHPDLDLSRYGLMMFDETHDRYSVHAWFVKAREI